MKLNKAGGAKETIAQTWGGGFGGRAYAPREARRAEEAARRNAREGAHACWPRVFDDDAALTVVTTKKDATDEICRPFVDGVRVIG